MNTMNDYLIKKYFPLVYRNGGFVLKLQKGGTKGAIVKGASEIAKETRKGKSAWEAAKSWLNRNFMVSGAADAKAEERAVRTGENARRGVVSNNAANEAMMTTPTPGVLEDVVMEEAMANAKSAAKQARKNYKPKKEKTPKEKEAQEKAIKRQRDTYEATAENPTLVSLAYRSALRSAVRPRVWANRVAATSALGGLGYGLFGPDSFEYDEDTRNTLRNLGYDDELIGQLELGKYNYDKENEYFINRDGNIKVDLGNGEFADFENEDKYKIATLEAALQQLYQTLNELNYSRRPSGHQSSEQPQVVVVENPSSQTPSVVPQEHIVAAQTVTPSSQTSGQTTSQITTDNNGNVTSIAGIPINQIQEMTTPSSQTTNNNYGYTGSFLETLYSDLLNYQGNLDNILNSRLPGNYNYFGNASSVYEMSPEDRLKYLELILYLASVGAMNKQSIIDALKNNEKYASYAL